MSRQNHRLAGMAMAGAVAIVASVEGVAWVAALTASMAGMWFSAYMRRVAEARGFVVKD